MLAVDAVMKFLQSANLIVQCSIFYSGSNFSKLILSIVVN